MYEIIDNYLKKEDFIKIQKWVLHRNFLWHFVDKPNETSTNEKQFQFGRVFVEYDGVIVDDAVEYLKIILEPYCKNKNIKVGINRAKINMYINVDNISRGLGIHQDIADEKNYKTLLFYLDTNNGCTKFESGETIETVENRALIFDAHLYHQTVTQTDSLFRRNININFKEL
jgi:hypothetical protein